MSRWIKTHKLLFFVLALTMMGLSLYSGINEKRKKNSSTGLVAFGLAVLITTFLLSYNKLKHGFWI